MKYGAILRACRERAGFSQEELAHQLNRQQACISRIEKDKKTLDVETLVEWAKLTSSQEVVVAFICGVDGLTVLADVLSTVGDVVSGFINFL